MSSRIYAKLAVTNIKNNGKTYVPFMLTAVLTVMMYYMMDTLARNDSIGNRNVTTVLFLTIPVMTLFSLIFLFYTNSFLIRRRKKEIAVYNILGMGKGHIGRMLTVETLIIWAVSLVLGILGGMVFGKLMHLLLLRILQYDVGIRFHISLPSILYTAVLFTFIFFLTWLYNLFSGKAGQSGGTPAGRQCGGEGAEDKVAPCSCRRAGNGSGILSGDHYGAAH